MQNLQKILFWLEKNQSNYWIFQIKKIIIYIPTIVFQLVLFFSLLYFLYFLLNRLKKHSFIADLVIIIIFFLSGIAWYEKNKILSKRCAFVVKDATFVYAGPERSFHKVAELKLETPIEILKTQNDMSQILSHQYSGWVQSNHLEIV